MTGRRSGGRGRPGGRGGSRGVAPSSSGQPSRNEQQRSTKLAPNNVAAPNGSSRGSRPSHRVYTPPAVASSMKGGKPSMTSAHRGRGGINSQASRLAQQARLSLDQSGGFSQRSTGGNPGGSKRSFAAGGSLSNRHERLKRSREAERKQAIQEGFLADPNKPRRLEDAITLVGTCQDMCPEFERVVRIIGNDVMNAEYDPSTLQSAQGNPVPSEARMVKKFRRPGAGMDDQLPSDLRPPQVLNKTVDYLLNDVLNEADSIAAVYYFIWDRTRAVRNDFSIQQVSKMDDVKLAIGCYERIARFHILTLHQLGGQENKPTEMYDWQQDWEQLGKTLISLTQYYDKVRGKYQPPNEAEFRAYLIILEIHSQVPDLEERVQKWPLHIVSHPRVQLAMKLYQAACNTEDEQGPPQFGRTRHVMAQANCMRFWKLVGSAQSSYLMSCVAEIHFKIVRKIALSAIWQSCQQGRQTRLEDWALSDLTGRLGFDTEEQVANFVGLFGFQVGNREDGTPFVDFSSVPLPRHSQHVQNHLPSPSGSLPPQTFSFSLVEAKRFGRSFSAIIAGAGVREARTGIKTDLDFGYSGQMSGVTMEVDTTFATNPAVTVLPEEKGGETVGGDISPIFVDQNIEAAKGEAPVQVNMTPMPNQPTEPLNTPQRKLDIAPIQNPPNADSSEDFLSKLAQTSSFKWPLFKSAPSNVEATSSNKLQSQPSVVTPQNGLEAPTKHASEQEGQKGNQLTFTNTPLHRTSEVPMASFSKPTPQSEVAQNPQTTETFTRTSTSPTTASPTNSIQPLGPSIMGESVTNQLSQPAISTFPGFSQNVSAIPELLPGGSSNTSTASPGVATSSPFAGLITETPSFSLTSVSPTKQPPQLPQLPQSSQPPQVSQPPTSSQFSRSPKAVSSLSFSTVSDQSSQAPIQPASKVQLAKERGAQDSPMWSRPGTATLIDSAKTTSRLPSKSNREVRKEQCLNFLAKGLLFHPTNGLLRQYVEWVARPLIEEALDEAQLEADKKLADSFRASVLQKRYGMLWKVNSAVLRHRRQGRERRRRLAAEKEALAIQKIRMERSPLPAIDQGTQRRKSELLDSMDPSSKASAVSSGKTQLLEQKPKKMNPEPQMTERSLVNAPNTISGSELHPENHFELSSTKSFRERLLSANFLSGEPIRGGEVGVPRRLSTTNTNYWIDKKLGLNKLDLRRKRGSSMHSRASSVSLEQIDNKFVNEKSLSRRQSIDMPNTREAAANFQAVQANIERFWNSPQLPPDFRPNHSRYTTLERPTSSPLKRKKDDAALVGVHEEDETLFKRARALKEMNHRTIFNLEESQNYLDTRSSFRSRASTASDEYKSAYAVMSRSNGYKRYSNNNVAPTPQRPVQGPLDHSSSRPKFWERTSRFVPKELYGKNWLLGRSEGSNGSGSVDQEDVYAGTNGVVDSSIESTDGEVEFQSDEESRETPAQGGGTSWDDVIEL